jgi:hypothetical protein
MLETGRQADFRLAQRPYFGQASSRSFQRDELHSGAVDSLFSHVPGARICNRQSGSRLHAIRALCIQRLCNSTRFCTCLHAGVDMETRSTDRGGGEVLRRLGRRARSAWRSRARDERASPSNLSAAPHQGRLADGFPRRRISAHREFVVMGPSTRSASAAVASTRQRAPAALPALQQASIGCRRQ